MEKGEINQEGQKQWRCHRGTEEKEWPHKWRKGKLTRRDKNSGGVTEEQKRKSGLISGERGN